MEEGFISLGKQSESIGISAEPAKQDKIYYPSLYINDIDLGLDEEDIGEVITATIKVKVNRVTTTIENKTTRQSLDLEVMGIKFDGDDKEDA